MSSFVASTDAMSTHAHAHTVADDVGSRAPFDSYTDLSRVDVVARSRSAESKVVEVAADATKWKRAVWLMLIPLLPAAANGVLSLAQSALSLFSHR